jgi:hypothetical protein
MQLRRLGMKTRTLHGNSRTPLRKSGGWPMHSGKLITPTRKPMWRTGKPAC